MSFHTVRLGLVAGMAVLFGVPAYGADEAKVKASIDAAVAYLKASAMKNVPGSISPDIELDGHGEGPAALAGIALLEAGVPANDPVILNIAKLVRQAGIPQSQTYVVALDILFLDKLGEPADTSLIQSLGARLVAAQQRGGGWGYGCPKVDEQEMNRLRGLLSGATLKGAKDISQIGLDPAKRPTLDPAVADMLAKGRWAQRQPDGEDNSNTQFALIALWAARRHGVPVAKALQILEARFRNTQSRSGGWSYIPGPADFPTGSMTCVGLLGLAVVHGMKGESSLKGTVIENGVIKPAPAKAKQPAVNMLADRAVQGGLGFLATVMRANRNPPPPGPAGGQGQAEALADDHYFLWSMERVCMVYNLDKIHDIDWHHWGATRLLGTQGRDGSWSGKHGPLPETCFALMFMLRSNIVKDLSKALKGSLDPTGLPGSAAKPPAGNDTKPPVGVKPADPKPPVGGNTAKPMTPAKPVEPAADSEATKLAKDLVAAGAAKKVGLFKQYTESSGVKYTFALAEAIADLEGKDKEEARDGLAIRMSRLSPKSLKDYLENESPEIRRAACLGAAMREERTLIPDLIKALDDDEEIVWRGARLALKTISKTDFGPKPGDSVEVRKKAAAAWQDWWKGQPK